VEQESDSEIVLTQAVKAGDSAAFSEIVRRHHRAVRSFLLVRMSNVHDSEDLAQEVFLTAFQQLGSFDGNRPIGPWLRGIAHNLLRNFQRKKSALAVGGDAELETLIQTEIDNRQSNGREADLFSALMECVGELPAEDQMIVKQRYIEEQSIMDLSRSLGKKHSAVTMRLHRLRQGLIACAEGKLATF
jgi:RNA polymerase sigma-70 factor (ECF subfamily)